MPIHAPDLPRLLMEVHTAVPLKNHHPSHRLRGLGLGSTKVNNPTEEFRPRSSCHTRNRQPYRQELIAPAKRRLQYVLRRKEIYIDLFCQGLAALRYIDRIANHGELKAPFVSQHAGENCPKVDAIFPARIRWC